MPKAASPREIAQSLAELWSLRIEMKSGNVVLDTGEMFVVPKGVRHNPVAEQECLVMLIERKSTLHTGNVVNERTRSLDEQLRQWPLDDGHLHSLD